MKSFKNDPQVLNHLSNERTFQAWIRSSVSLIGFGFVIEKFSVFLNQNKKSLHLISGQNGLDYSWIVGLVMILLGTLILIFSYKRYLKIAQTIGDHEHFPSKHLSLLVVVVVVISIALLIFDLLARF